MEGWFFEPGTITYDEFFARNRAGRDKGLDHWSHLVSWWEQRDNPNVLLVSYEQMVEDPKWLIKRMAAFCNIDLDDELLAVTVEHSSRSFMLEHKDRFDDAMMRAKSERVAGLPPGSDSAKIRQAGQKRRREALPAALRQEFADIWQSDVKPHTGLPDYASLEAELRRHNT
jgi:Arc/MetJ family transcription regulator